MNLTEKQLKNLVSQFLVHLGIDFTDLEFEAQENGQYRINVVSNNPSLLIGHRGENLIAMQKLIKIMALKEWGEDIEIDFDVDDYRKRQVENVILLADQKIKEVQETKHQAALPPMSPVFRRIVHLYIRDKFNDLETESVGNGNYRQVMIKMKA